MNKFPYLLFLLTAFVVTMMSCSDDDTNPVEIEKIELAADDFTLPLETETTLKVTILPENATNRTLKWSSSNPAVVEVDQNGKLTPKSEGEAVITAKAGDKAVTCTVKIKPLKAEIFAGVDLYTIGTIDGIATLWKNGEATQLTKAGKRAYPQSILVEGNDVYIVGYYSEEIAPQEYIYKTFLWKNGQETILSETGTARFISKNGNDIYITGTEGNNAVMWKNGTKTVLLEGIKGTGAGRTIFSGNDVYVVVNKGYETYLWKDGELEVIIDNNSTEPTGKKIPALSDNTYLAYTSVGSQPYLWKNGEMIKLPSTADSYIYDMFVSGNDVYTTGTTAGFTQSVLWKNQESKTVYSTPQLLASQPTSVYVVDNNVYLAGQKYLPNSTECTITLWKNEEEVTLNNGKTYNFDNGDEIVITDIYVVKK